MTADWTDFFNADHSIYVNARHKALHAQFLARDISALIPFADAQALDFGCGEALAAPEIAARCGTLFFSIRRRTCAINCALRSAARRTRSC